MTQKTMNPSPNSVDVSNRIFNSLPIEIIKEILSNIDCQDLLFLKVVCTYWRDIIQELLYVEKIQVSTEKFENAVNIYVPWKQRSNGRYSFSMHRSSYSLTNIISKAMLDIHTQDYVYSLREVQYTDVLEKLKRNAQNGGAYTSGCEDITGSMWRTILGMTEIQYSVEELRNKDVNSKIVESSLSKYTWYTYMSDNMMHIAWDAGFVALYPDKKTFSVLFATDHD